MSLQEIEGKYYYPTYDCSLYGYDKIMLNDFLKLLPDASLIEDSFLKIEDFWSDRAKEPAKAIIFGYVTLNKDYDDQLKQYKLDEEEHKRKVAEYKEKYKEYQKKLAIYRKEKQVYDKWLKDKIVKIEND